MIEEGMGYNQVLQGNALEILKGLPAESVDCVFTSPPYWALRTYEEASTLWDGNETCEHQWREAISNSICNKCGAWKGQLGNEPDFNLYIKHLCDIFDEVKRIMKSTGTCWVNLGDTYYNKAEGISVTLSPKSLVQIPARFSIEMANRGWILRNKIIWKKTNAMPNSVADRFTNSYEEILFFVKSKSYYFNQQFDKREYPNQKIKNVYKEIVEKTKLKRTRKLDGRKEYAGKSASQTGIQSHSLQTFLATIRATGTEVIKLHPDLTKEDKEFLRSMLCNTAGNVEGRNMRDVWSINTQNNGRAHYATFGEKLCEIPINAGCPPNGIILDPFLGSGTVAVVAQRLDRKWIGIEISPKYVDIATNRIKEAVKQVTL